MAQQFRIQRLIASVAVVAGQPATLDLPRAYDYEALHLRLNGNVNVTTAYTTVRPEAPAQAISRVELVADGRNTLFSAPFWYCVQGKYDRPNFLGAATMNTPPSAATIANYAVEAQGIVDFQSPDTIRGKDSNFRTSALQLWQLKLTFGNPGDMFTGAGVAAFSNLFVEVSSSEMIELPDANGNRTTPNLLKKVSYQEIALPANNVNQEVRLPAGNLIKSVMVRTEVSGDPSAAVLNNVMAFSGTDVRVKMSGAGLRKKNQVDFGFNQTGYYVADFVRSGDGAGNLSELWDVTKQAEPKLSLDVNGSVNNKCQVVVCEYLPVPA
jgi:hypothetical protein